MNSSHFPQMVRPLEHLAAHTPLRVGGQCLAWMEVYSELQLQDLMSFLKKNELKWKIHWPFEDWLALDGGFNGVIVRLGGVFSERSHTEDGLTLGSAALFSSVKKITPWGHFFDGWSGTPGGLWASQQQDLLKGFVLELHWIKRSSSGALLVQANEELPTLPPNSVISKIVLKEHSKRKRARRPKRNGQVFVDKKTRQCAAHLLEAHQLGGTRLRNWAISQHPPGRIIHLITPVRETAQNRHVVQFSPESLLPDQNGTESTDLLELGKAIAQRIKRRSQRDIIIDLPKIRTNKRSKRTAQS